ncbi:MAG: hypothetical protein U0531_16425 [Dehalococcoidia bacterium]
MIALIAFGVSIPVGIISAVRRDTWVDYLLRGFAISGRGDAGLLRGRVVQECRAQAESMDN